MIIYLAARYSRRAEMQTVARDLEGLGHTVFSRWIYGGHAVPPGTDPERVDRLRAEWAIEDWDDLMASDCCIAFTEEPRSTLMRGGRHVEFGAAIAYGLRVIVVGPRENIFHHLPDLERYATWRDCLDALECQQAARSRFCAALAERWQS